jgi:hypothetical protein
MEPRPFLKSRYRVHAGKQPDGDHWSGGPAYHRGARCPVCKIPLLLLWDINCTDPRFPRRRFGPLRRLPLYFCWGCVGDLCYQVVDDKRIRIFRGYRYKGPNFPYEPYPECFERRPLALDDARPDEIVRLVRLIYAQVGDENAAGPSAKEYQVLRRFFGHRVVSGFCTVHHQLGGRPISLYWAMEVFRCPNPACSGASKGNAPGAYRAMKFLAGVLNDPWGGLPMAEPATKETKKDWDYYVSVQFHICDRCWTIYACNRCD